jgi:Gas vesicle protein
MNRNQAVMSSVHTDNLADILERVLDKGIVIAGDITVKLVDVELLTIQVRLLVASVDKAKEMGINWWENNAFYGAIQHRDRDRELEALRTRVLQLEERTPAAALG